MRDFTVDDKREQEQEWLSLWEIGQVFGVGVKEVGRWLEERNLMTKNRRPSHAAIETRYCDHKPDWQGRLRWCWNRKLIAEFTLAGHIRSDHPVSKDATELHGPFVTRLNGSDNYEIVGDDGKVAARVAGQTNAAFLLKLLNLAHTCGKV